jgi:hypothetical protein
MKHDENAPATKKDVQLLMEEIGKLYVANERWKDEILDKNEAWKDEIVHEFKVVAEDLRHDLLGVHKDKIENHEDRLVRLERHVGVRAG